MVTHNPKVCFNDNVTKAIQNTIHTYKYIDALHELQAGVSLNVLPPKHWPFTTLQLVDGVNFVSTLVSLYATYSDVSNI